MKSLSIWEGFFVYKKIDFKKKIKAQELARFNQSTYKLYLLGRYKFFVTALLDKAFDVSTVVN